MVEQFGNPSSIHAFGREARQGLDTARRTCAQSINGKSNEIIFTSGGTESDNLAIFGVAYANRDKGNHIITSSIEHHAVLHTCEQLEKDGFQVTYLPVDEEGKVSAQDVQEALREDTILVTIMLGNNEVGSVQPIAKIGELLKNHQAYFHTDAVQAYGLIPIDVEEMGIDLLSISAHKINGPKGVGFLYVNESVQLAPQAFGGEQERKRRAGTENVPGIIGLAEAVRLGKREREEKIALYEQYKKVILSTFDDKKIHYTVNSPSLQCLPHVLNIAFEGIDIESFLINLDLAGIAASGGSACTAGSVSPSHVLVAMFGKDSSKVRSSVRFSFGLGNTPEQIATMAQKTVDIVNRLTAK